MDILRFLQTSDGHMISIPKNHPIFRKGIFSVIEENSKVPFTVDDFCRIVHYYIPIEDDEILFQMIKKILPFSLEEIETFWIKQLLKNSKQVLKNKEILKVFKNTNEFIDEKNNHPEFD